MRRDKAPVTGRFFLCRKLFQIFSKYVLTKYAKGDSMSTTEQGKPKGSSTGSGRAKRRQGLRKSTKEEPQEEHRE